MLILYRENSGNCAVMYLSFKFFLSGSKKLCAYDNRSIEVLFEEGHVTRRLVSLFCELTLRFFPTPLQ